MNLPAVGDTITTQDALGLCRHFDLQYLVERIEGNPDCYRCWRFDGISGLSERFAAWLTRVDRSTLTLQCALPHDLRYGYGEPGNKAERKSADKQFRQDLISKAEMGRVWARIFYWAVRIGGSERRSSPYSWAFAQQSS
jgi:hypothetical protein